MNFSSGLSLFTNLVLKNLGSVFGCHTDSLIWIYNTKFKQPGCYDFSAATFSNYITPTAKPVAGISPIGMS